MGSRREVGLHPGDLSPQALRPHIRWGRTRMQLQATRRCQDCPGWAPAGEEDAQGWSHHHSQLSLMMATAGRRMGLKPLCVSVRLLGQPGS